MTELLHQTTLDTVLATAPTLTRATAPTITRTSAPTSTLAVDTAPRPPACAPDPQPAVLAADERAGRRGRARSSTVHAVPVTDRTRTAVCGARVAASLTVWTPGRDGACPECLALVGHA